MRDLLSVRAFHRLAAAFVLAELIEWFALITLAVVVFDETASAWATTALFVSTKLIPSTLVPVLAARTDAWASTRGIGTLFGIEAVAFAALAAAVTNFSLPLICVLALLDGTIAALVRALTRAAIATTMEPLNLLREANAVLNVGFAVMNVAGPAAAGILVAATAPPTVMLIGAALLLMAGLYVGLDPASRAAPTDDAPWLGRFREGLAYVRDHPLAMVLILGEGVVLMFGTLVAPIEVIYAKESLDAGSTGYAALAASWGAGITIGSLVFARAGRRSLPLSLLISTAVMGAGILMMAGAPTLVFACAAAVLGGAGNGVQWVSAVTAVQEAISADMQVRVAGVFEAVITFVPGIGFLLGGLITTATSPRAAFVIAGTGILVGSAVGTALYVLRFRRGLLPA